MIADCNEKCLVKVDLLTTGRRTQQTICSQPDERPTRTYSAEIMNRNIHNYKARHDLSKNTLETAPERKVLFISHHYKAAEVARNNGIYSPAALRF